jgi:uncharacterized protein (DUF1684 family)
MLLSAASIEDYKADILNWQKQRDAKLRQPDSWLTLVGLFWLKDGTNTIGSAETNDFVLPPGSSPAFIAELQLHDGLVTIAPHSGVPLLVNGKPVTTPTTLTYEGEKPDKVTVDRISFFIIKRGARLAIRAKDSQSEVLKNFTGMNYFPINPAYRIEARFIPDEKKIPVPNILGEVEQELSPGYVEFQLNGKPVRMRPVFEGETLFFIFKDETRPAGCSIPRCRKTARWCSISITPITRRAPSRRTPPVRCHQKKTFWECVLKQVNCATAKATPSRFYLSR